MKIDKMVEQTNQSENNLMKSEHQNGGKTGHTRIEDGSYDKDVVEIKLPDTVFSNDYVCHFVKDVCIDEGVRADQKTPTAKLVDQNVSPDFESSIRDTKRDLRQEIRTESTKSGHEPRSQIVILPVTCATDNNTGEPYSSSNAQEREGRNTASAFTKSSNETSSSPEQPVHDTTNGSHQVAIVMSEGTENQDPCLNGGANHKVSSNDFHENGIDKPSEMSNIIHNDLPIKSSANVLPVVMPEEDVSTGLDKEGSNQVNHYNPFIAYGSLDDTWESQYSLPTTATSIAPISPVGKTDSFSDLVNRAPPGGFDSIGIVEDIIEDNRSDSAEASSSMVFAKASEENNDQRESVNNETRTDVQDDTDMDTSMSVSNAEPSDVKSEGPSKFEIDSSQDAHDFNPRDVDVGAKRNKENTDNKSSTHLHTEPVIQHNGPDSAKVTTQSVIRNPFESSFSGPSITSGPLTPSGHIPYSGNISLRSESSTTSTRSFAFPVLQTEWNSSPVKMAKADRRRMREDRGWSYRILCCCKF